jgi:predicted transcriptional regulator
MTTSRNIRQILMAIPNELSSDVAVALLAKKKSPQELNRLKDIILEVHSALQKMSEETRTFRFRKKTEDLSDKRSLTVSE